MLKFVTSSHIYSYDTPRWPLRALAELWAACAEKSKNRFVFSIFCHFPYSSSLDTVYGPEKWCGSTFPNNTSEATKFSAVDISVSDCIAWVRSSVLQFRKSDSPFRSISLRSTLWSEVFKAVIIVYASSGKQYFVEGTTKNCIIARKT